MKNVIRLKPKEGIIIEKVDVEKSVLEKPFVIDADENIQAMLFADKAGRPIEGEVNPKEYVRNSKQLNLYSVNTSMFDIKFGVGYAERKITFEERESKLHLAYAPVGECTVRISSLDKIPEMLHSLSKTNEISEEDFRNRVINEIKVIVGDSCENSIRRLRKKELNSEIDKLAESESISNPTGGVIYQKVKSCLKEEGLILERMTLRANISPESQAKYDQFITSSETREQAKRDLKALKGED